MHTQIEQILFIYMLCVSLSGPNEEGILYRKVCLTYFDADFCEQYSQNTRLKSKSLNNSEIFDSKPHRRHAKQVFNKTKEDQLQKLSSKWIIYNNIVLAILSCVTTLIYGAWSDTVSRKYPILIALFGVFLSNLSFLIISHDINRWPLQALFIPNFIMGLFGASNTLFSSVSSYVSHLSNKPERMLHLASLESIIMLGSSIGYSLSGVITEKYGFFNSFLIVCFLNTFLILHAMFSLDDVRPENIEIISFKQTLRNCINFLYIKKTLSICFMPRGRHINTCIFLLMSAMIINSFVNIGESTITYIYLFKSPISLTQTEYGYYRALRTFLIGFSLTVILPILRKLCKVSDMFCILLGTLSRSAVDLMYAFSKSKFLIFMIPVPGMFTSYVALSIRAYLSQLVLAETGKLFSFISAIEMIDSLFASFVFNQIYSWSLPFYPGLVFIISFIVHSFTILFYILIIIYCRKIVLDDLQVNQSEEIVLLSNDEIF